MLAIQSRQEISDQCSAGKVLKVYIPRSNQCCWCTYLEAISVAGAHTSKQSVLLVHIPRSNQCCWCTYLEAISVAGAQCTYLEAVTSRFLDMSPQTIQHDAIITHLVVLSYSLVQAVPLYLQRHIT